MALRHPEYYMQDGDVIFLVENKLFRIHKRLLTRSEANAFAMMFDLPKSSQTEGETDETPIVLNGDNAEDFEGLMRILYPPLLEDPKSIAVCIFAQAMRIATKYCMEEVQAAIVRVIESKWLGPDISGPISILCFIAEFPGHFKKDYRKDYVQQIFVQACSVYHYPSAEDLGRLMAYPDIMVAMMKYREGELNPARAVWKGPHWFPVTTLPVTTAKRVNIPVEANVWLSRELNSLGLTN